MHRQSSLLTFVKTHAYNGETNRKRCLLPKLPTTSENSTANNKRPKLTAVKRLDSDHNQMIIDAGQRRFGTEQCSSCGMSYDPTFGPDFVAHKKHHFSVLNRSQVDFPTAASKSSTVVQEFDDGFIYKMDTRSTSKDVMEFLDDLVSVTNREFNSSSTMHNVEDRLIKNHGKLFLFAHNPAKGTKKVIGCLETRRIEKAFDYFGGGISAEESAKPAKLGIDRIWVSKDFRRRGIATRLIDCARCNSMPGYVAPKHEVAFSDPTENGLTLARSYFESDSFLVYISFDEDTRII